MPLFWAHLLRASHLQRHFVARSQFYLKLDDFGWRGRRTDQHQNAGGADPHHLVHSGRSKYRFHVSDCISVSVMTTPNNWAKLAEVPSPSETMRAKLRRNLMHYSFTGTASMQALVAGAQPKDQLAVSMEGCCAAIAVVALGASNVCIECETRHPSSMGGLLRPALVFT